MIETLDIDSFTGDVWITSDLHLGHKNLLEHRTQWNNIDKHDNTLIRNAQEIVKPGDLYIINGDLTMHGQSKIHAIRRFTKQLPGKKILVLGNHDKLRAQNYINMGFILIATSLVLKDGILVAHDPANAEVWPKDKPMLCGHIHSMFQFLKNVVNVGVDVWDWKPIHLEDAIALAYKSMHMDWSLIQSSWSEISKERHKVKSLGNANEK